MCLLCTANLAQTASKTYNTISRGRRCSLLCTHVRLVEILLQVLAASLAALEQLQAPYAEWAAGAAALAQQLPAAVAASAPQQAPAVQVLSSVTLHDMKSETCRPAHSGLAH